MTEPMTRSELDKIRAAEQAATPGEWISSGGYGYIFAKDQKGKFPVAQIRGWGHFTGTGGWSMDEKKAVEIQDANETFIALSRTAVPRLLAEVDRLSAENAALKQAERDNAVYLAVHGTEIGAE